LNSIRICDTLDYQSAILSIFAIERISKVSEFLILWTTSFCSFKYISQKKRHENYQNFWYFGLPVCNFKYIWDWEDFKSIRISDTLDYQSAILSICEIERISKVSEFLILWTTSFCSFKYISHIRDLKTIRISDTLDYQSAILNIFEIERISKVSEFLILL
jgi:hypothetical protein